MTLTQEAVLIARAYVRGAAVRVPTTAYDGDAMTLQFAKAILAQDAELAKLRPIADVAKSIVDEGCCTCQQTMSCLVCKEILKLEQLLEVRP